MNIEEKTQYHAYLIGEKFSLSSISSDLKWQQDIEQYGYKFSHWTLTEDDVEPFFEDREEVTFSNSQTNIYAQWERMKYLVRFLDINSEEIRDLSQYVYHGESAIAEQPVVEGYFSNGWEPNPVNVKQDMICSGKYIRYPHIIYHRYLDKTQVLSTVQYNPYTEITDLSVISPSEFKRPYYKCYDSYIDNNGNQISFPFTLISTDVHMYIDEIEKKFIPNVQDSYKYDGEEHGLSIINLGNTVECDDPIIQYSENTIPRIWYPTSPKIINGTKEIICHISAEDFRDFEEVYSLKITNGYQIKYNWYQQDGVMIDKTSIYPEHADARIVPVPDQTTISTFVRWDKDSQISDVQNDIETYAIYEKKEFEVKYFNDQWHNPPYEEIIEKRENVKYGEDAVNTGGIQRSGWQWFGWTSKNGGSIELSNITQNMSAYADLKKIVSLSILQKWGSNEKYIKCSEIRLSGDTISYDKIKTKYIDENPIEKYTFTGVSPYYDTYIINENSVITANYSLNTFKVTFDPVGGTTPITEKTVTYGQPYGSLPTPEKEACSFNGWYDISGDLIQEDTIFNKDYNETLSARWTELNVLQTSDKEYISTDDGFFIEYM